MNTNKNEPAFPHETVMYEDSIPIDIDLSVGMSKRFYAACAAMQGLLSNGSPFKEESIIAIQAFMYADALLEHEEYLNKQDEKD